MYEAFYGLREAPFDLTPNPRYLVLTDTHREALSNLEYGIARQKGLTLLIGEAGSGKTTIIRTALSRQSSRVHCVYLNNPALTRSEFLEMLAIRFELGHRAAESKTALLVELESLIARRRTRGEATVLVVDEAQRLSFELLEEIRLLANMETNREKLLSVIVAGQPDLAHRLNDPQLEQFKQRIALRCELRPLTLEETVAYIVGRITEAGGVATQLFTREAVDMIHDRSKGIPRKVSVIADNALLSAFAAGQRPVTSRTVLDVCRDFDLGTAPDLQAQPPANPAPPAATAHVNGNGARNDAAAGSDNGQNAVAADRPKGDGPMFTSLYGKRRGFSLFGSLGNRP